MAKESHPGIFLFVSEWVVTALLPVLFLKYYYYYYYILRVSNNTVLIIRMSNCINTVSGIVLSVSDHPVCRLRRKFLLNLHI